MSSNILTERDTNAHLADAKMEENALDITATDSVWVEKASSKQPIENVDARYEMTQFL